MSGFGYNHLACNLDKEDTCEQGICCWVQRLNRTVRLSGITVRLNTVTTQCLCTKFVTGEWMSLEWYVRILASYLWHMHILDVVGVGFCDFTHSKYTIITYIIVYSYIHRIVMTRENWKRYPIQRVTCVLYPVILFFLAVFIFSLSISRNLLLWLL